MFSYIFLFPLSVISYQLITFNQANFFASMCYIIKWMQPLALSPLFPLARSFLIVLVLPNFHSRLMKKAGVERLGGSVG